MGGICYHVLNRGNARQAVFHKDQDYQAFTDLMGQACERVPMRVIGYCIMPTHFHLVLWPHEDGELSRWMQWLMTSHVRRYHTHYDSSGHVWQGRFKAFPIQQDAHLLTVTRYVERNPLRAGLVANAQDWPWSSAVHRTRPGSRLLKEGPLSLGEDWLEQVNTAQSLSEEEDIRRCAGRGAPYGDTHWQASVARQLGLESSLRPLGRPRK